MTDVKLVTNADTGTADIVGGDDWDDIATKVNGYVNEFQSPTTYTVYVAGSNKKAYNNNTKAVDFTNTDATVVLQGAIDALGNTSGRKITVKAGFYSNIGALNFTAIDGYCTLEGESEQGITQIRPTTDTPAVTITGAKTRIILKNIYFTHNQAGYTSNLVEFKNGAVGNQLVGCAFYDFGTKKGNAIGLISTTANVYSNIVRDCLIDGFDNAVFGNVTNSSFFCNGNYFRGGKFQNFKRALTATTSASCAFDSNNFVNVDMQCYAGTLIGFDYNTTHSGHSFFTVHENINMVDLPGGINYADINGTTELLLTGCYPDWLIGGTTTKLRRNGYYSKASGLGTFSGDGSTKTFTVTHNMNASQAPTIVTITPMSADAIGSAYVNTSSLTSTQFVLTYLVAPPTGTNNVKFSWRCEFQ